MNLLKIRRPARDRRGMTLIEYLIAVAMLSVVVGTLITSSRDMIVARSSETTRARLQTTAQDALVTITEDLRLSGFVAGPPDYPYVFTDGQAQGAFAAFAHPPAPETVAPGVPGFGPDREIVFLLPADANGDGVPDLAATGELLWDAVDYGYVLVEGPDGTPQLERRIDGQLDRVIARNVERITFDTTLQDAAIPLGSVRVRLWLRMSDETGLSYPHFLETTVRLRNSTDLPDPG